MSRTACMLIGILIGVVVVSSSCGSSNGDSAVEVLNYDYGKLPLDANIYSPDSDIDHDVAIARTRHEAFEDHVAQCMRRQGFEYTPRPYLTEELTNPIDSRAAIGEQRDWVEEHGYGISTLISDDATAMELLGSDDVVGTGASGRDANADYLASLEPHERNAYQEAFGGFETGCSGEAFEPAEEARRQAIESLERTDAERISERFYTAVGKSEEYEAAYEHWYGCMRERGWQFRDHLEATDEVSSRVSALANSVSSLEDELDAAELAELQAYERALAADDLECYLTEVFVRQRRIEADIQASIAEELPIG